MNRCCAIAALIECFQEKPSWCRHELLCQRIALHIPRSNCPTDWMLHIKSYLLTYFAYPLFSKIFEQLWHTADVFHRFKQHVVSFVPFNQFHFTETVLLKVNTDVTVNMDKAKLYRLICLIWQQ